MRAVVFRLTRLVVSNLGIVFDNLLILKDLFNIVSDLIYIAKNMPISAIQITGKRTSLMCFFRARTKKRLPK